MRYRLVCLLALALLSGCATTQTHTSGPLIGHEFVFTTKEPAPADMDAFTFFWDYPLLERFDTQVVRTIVLPDGNEQVVDPDATGPAGKYDFVRSDNGPDDDTLAPAQFRDRYITTIFRSTNGRMRMPRDIGSYAFYKKNKDGKINWRQPSTQVESKVTVK